MVWLDAHPLTPLQSASCLSFSVVLCLLTGKGEGDVEEPDHKTARKPGPLQVLLNTLCVRVYIIIMSRWGEGGIKQNTTKGPLA